MRSLSQLKSENWDYDIMQWNFEVVVSLLYKQKKRLFYTTLYVSYIFIAPQIAQMECAAYFTGIG